MELIKGNKYMVAEDMQKYTQMIDEDGYLPI